MAESLTPCHAIAVGILSFDQPTIVRCGDVEGHDGPHHMTMTWESQDIETIARYFPDRQVTLSPKERAQRIAQRLTGGQQP